MKIEDIKVGECYRFFKESELDLDQVKEDLKETCYWVEPEMTDALGRPFKVLEIEPASEKIPSQVLCKFWLKTKYGVLVQQSYWFPLQTIKEEANPVEYYMNGLNLFCELYSVTNESFFIKEPVPKDYKRPYGYKEYYDRAERPPIQKYSDGENVYYKADYALTRFPFDLLVPYIPKQDIQVELVKRKEDTSPSQGLKLPGYYSGPESESPSQKQEKAQKMVKPGTIVYIKEWEDNGRPSHWESEGKMDHLQNSVFLLVQEEFNGCKIYDYPNERSWSLHSHETSPPIEVGDKLTSKDSGRTYYFVGLSEESLGDSPKIMVSSHPKGGRIQLISVSKFF